MTWAILVLLAGCSGPSHPKDSGKVISPDETGDTGGDTGGDTDTGIPAAVVCDRTLPWTYVAAGVGQTCGVHTDGCAECWGAGEDDMGPSYDWNGEDRPPTGQYVSIHMIRNWESGYAQQNCGILADGNGVCFGVDNFGEMDLQSGDYSDLALTAYYTVAVSTDGLLSLAPFTPGVAPAGTFTRAEADDDYMLLLGTDGSLSEYYRLTTLIDYRPGPYIAMSRAVYPYGVCAVTAEGAVEYWNDDGSTLAAYGEFAAMAPTSGMKDVCFSSYELAACGLASDGHIECWAPGIGAWLPRNAPTRSDFVQLACGTAHACALTSGGEIECWGGDVYGETIPPT